MAQKFFEIIPSGTKIDFIGKSFYVFLLSGFLMLGTLVLIFTRGLNYGVDFKGGTEIHVRFQDQLQAADIRKVLEPIGVEDAIVQGFGEKRSGEFLIRVQPEDLNLEAHKIPITQALNRAGPNHNQGGEEAKIRFSEERLYVTYSKEADTTRIKSELEQLKILNLSVDSVSRFGTTGANEYLVQFSGVANRIISAFKTQIGTGKFEVLQVEQVGAKVGSELRMQAIGAILISIVLILIYVWFRFDLEFAPGAIVALIHDAFMVIGVFSLFRLQFDLSIVAAILTIVGFSVNDTIVIYDRIRENIKKAKDINLPLLINESINESLGRTILTTGTVLMTTVTLLLLGGPITFNFALAFTVGLISGVYSTVYVASPLTIYFYTYLQRKRGR